MAPLSWRVLRIGDAAFSRVTPRQQADNNKHGASPPLTSTLSPLTSTLSPSSAEIVLSVSDCEEWFADTAEGRLTGRFSVRHPDFDGTVGSFLYEECGGATLFDSHRTPFGLDDAHAAVGFVSGGQTWELRGLNGRRVRLLDRIGSDHGLKIAIELHEGEDPQLFTFHSSLFIPGSEAQAVGTGDARLRQIAGGWVFEEGRLRVRFARNGAIVGAWRQDGDEWTEVIRDAQIVSPRGWNWKHAPNGFEQRLDLEPDIAFSRATDGTLECSFAGRLRGAGRTGKMQRPVHYKTTLRFNGDEGFDLATSCSVEADSADSDASLTFRSAFVAPVIDLPKIEWAENGKVSAGDKRGFSARISIPRP